MALVRPTDLTLRVPRISDTKFKQVLSGRNSPALPEADAIWAELLRTNVDPSFALGQFLCESLYGTSGHAKVTKSWGNILWDPTWTADQPKYIPGNGYTYAKYPNWLEGVKDYCEYVNRFAVTTDVRYGGITDTIDKATARWVGDPLTSEEHKNYVVVLINAINNTYEFVPGAFVEVGDKMIYAGKAGVVTAAKYPVKNGTALYRGTNGDILKYAAFDEAVGICRFLGPVGQAWTDPSWQWGAVIIGTKAADANGTILYIKNPDKKLVTGV